MSGRRKTRAAAVGWGDDVEVRETRHTQAAHLMAEERQQRWMRKDTVQSRNSRCIITPSCIKPMHFTGACQRAAEQ